MRASLHLDIAITPITGPSRSDVAAFSGGYSCMLTLRFPGVRATCSIGGAGRSQAAALAQALHALAEVLGSLSPSEIAKVSR